MSTNDTTQIQPTLVPFIKLVDEYIAHAKFAKGANPETSTSSRIFNDGKKLTQMRNGDGITLKRLGKATEFLSNNWPEGATWPKDVARPPVQLEAAE